MTNNRARARRILDAMTGRWGKPATTRDAVQSLADAGLLAPEPKIIRTREELTSLDPDTLLYGRYEGYDSHLNVADLQYLSGNWRPEVERALPAVVIATGDTVRAARQALKEAADAVD